MNGADIQESHSLDVLIVVEDPGAANYVVDLPMAAKDANISCQILAVGFAWDYLRDREVECVKYPLGLSALEFMEECSFKLLLSGTSQNPDSPVLALIDECKRRGVPTVAFVDMAVDADLRFKGRSANPLKHQPDCLIVVDRSTEAAFQKLGFNSLNIHVCGHPAYDRVRRRAHCLAGCDRSRLRHSVLGKEPFPRPVWVFAAEHDGNDARMRWSPCYTLHGRGHTVQRGKIVLEEVLDARASMHPKPFLVLRLHPKNTKEEFLRYSSEVDMFSQGGDPFDLIWISDLVIGMSSILLIEAALAGRETLSVVPRESERNWCPSVMEGLTPCVTTRDQLIEVIGKTAVVKNADFEVGSVSRILDVLREKVGN